MFTSNETLTTLENQLIEINHKIAAQRRSIEKLNENVKQGGCGGIVPPHVSQAILQAYENEAQNIKSRMNELQLNQLKTELTTAQNNLVMQEKSMQSLKDNVRRGGTGGIVPPHISQAILKQYQEKVRELEGKIAQLEPGDVKNEKKNSKN
jgi:hypothetical protein